MRCKRSVPQGEVADMGMPVARPEHWGGELSEDPILCSQLPEAAKLCKTSAALKNRRGSGVSDVGGGGAKRRRSTGRPTTALADLTNVVASALELPAARPEHWSGELTEDPIFCSQAPKAVSSDWFIAQDVLDHKAGVDKLGGDADGKKKRRASTGNTPDKASDIGDVDAKKKRRASMGDATAQASERLRQPPTPATARVGGLKLKGPPSQVPMISLEFYFGPARANRAIQDTDVLPQRLDCGLSRKSCADHTGRTQVIIPASVVATKAVPSPLTRLNNLHTFAVGTPVSVEAVVDTVGDLVVEELGMQPGEFVKYRSITLQQDAVVCQWLLWAADAQRLDSQLEGQRLVIRRAKVCCGLEGRYHLSGCAGGVELCSRVL